jgi:hypothetical protein
MAFLFGIRRITKRYTDRYPDSRRMKAWAGKLVHISTDRGLWRPDAKGYTDKSEEAWVLPIEDAIKETQHLGPERRTTFIRADDYAGVSIKDAIL